MSSVRSSATAPRLVLTCCDVDLEQRIVHRDGATTILTPKEAEALRYLAERAGRVVSREELEREVWGFRDGVDSQAVAVCLRRLRAKIEASSRRPDHIRTVRGVGWLFDAGGMGPSLVEAARRDELPRFGTPFVGRADDVSRVLTALAANRLVTVHGPAGIGKTRLAIRCAADTEASTQLFTDLSDATDADAVVLAMARTLGVSLASAATTERAREQIGTALADLDAAVLVVDNAEQVAGPLGHCITAWLDASEVTFLVTSRRPLGLDAERVERLSEMPVAEGVTLFATRARMLDAAFDPLREGGDVARLVGLLDGLPLAIELAASQLRLLRPAQVIERLGSTVYAPGAKGQHALWRAVQTSWDLLGDDERVALAALSIFEGGFLLEAAEAMSDGSDPVATLGALVDQALVQREDVGGANRFHMHAAVRAFGRAQLGAEETDQAWIRAATHLVEVGELQLFALPSDQDGSLFRGLASERTNQRAAARRCAELAPELALRLLLVLQPVHMREGPHPPAIALLEEVSRRAETQDIALLSRLDIALANLLMEAGRWADAGEVALRCAARARTAGHPQQVARAWTIVGAVRRRESRWDEAMTALAHAIDAAIEAGSPDLQASALANLGSVYAAAGRVVDAEQMYMQAIALRSGLGADRHEAMVRFNLGSLFIEQGQLARGEGEYRDALAVFERVSDGKGVASVTAALASVRADLGQLDGARRQAAAAVGLMRAAGMQQSEGMALGVLALILAELGDLAGAEEHLRTAQQLQRTLPDTLFLGQSTGFLGLVAWLGGDRDYARAQLDECLRLYEVAGNPFIVGYFESYRAALEPEPERRDALLAAALERLTGAADLPGLGVLKVVCEHLGHPFPADQATSDPSHSMAMRIALRLTA